MQEKTASRMRYLRYLLYLLPIPLLATIYLPFLNNPLVFDDIPFFYAGHPEKYLAYGFLPVPRWWVYQTLVRAYIYIGPELPLFRLINLGIHVLVAIALFFLLRRLLQDFENADAAPSGIRSETAAFMAATLFAFHPLANFAQGYLIERTILCATLFALLCWLLFWNGLNGSRLALWGSLVAYVLSVYSKEHAIMVPAVCFLMLVLYMRSNMKIKARLPEIMAMFLLQGLLALFIVFQAKGILAKAYEPFTADMMKNAVTAAASAASTASAAIEAASAPTANLYPISALNQAGLFFKYLFLWLLPNPGSISLDMREPFPSSFGSWSLWAGAGLYAAFGAIAAFLLYRGKKIGLLGMSMLGIWALFFTEFSTVRLQEIFVLYRSYLWMPLLFIPLAVGLCRLSKPLAVFLFALLVLFFAALSFDRLTVLSHPYHVWNEAAELYEKRQPDAEILGGYRIYFNRGHALHRDRLLDAAMADYDRALSLKPDLGLAHYEQGMIYLDRKEWQLAQEKFETAIRLMPGHSKSWEGHGRALERLGDANRARISFLAACDLGSKTGCNRLGQDKEIVISLPSRPASQ